MQKREQVHGSDETVMIFGLPPSLFFQFVIAPGDCWFLVSPKRMYITGWQGLPRLPCIALPSVLYFPLEQVIWKICKGIAQSLFQAPIQKVTKKVLDLEMSYMREAKYPTTDLYPPKDMNHWLLLKSLHICERKHRLRKHRLAPPCAKPSDGTSKARSISSFHPSC